MKKWSAGDLSGYSKGNRRPPWTDVLPFIFPADVTNYLLKPSMEKSCLIAYLFASVLTRRASTSRPIAS